MHFSFLFLITLISLLFLGSCHKDIHEFQEGLPLLNTPAPIPQSPNAPGSLWPIITEECLEDCTSGSVQNLKKLFLVSDGTPLISALGEDIYISGLFTKLTHYHTGGEIISTQSGGNRTNYADTMSEKPWKNYLNLLQTKIYLALTHTSGDVYLLGEFQKKNGEYISILKLNAQMKIDETFPNFYIQWNYSPYLGIDWHNHLEAIIKDNKLILIGEILSVNGQPRNNGFIIDLEEKTLLNWELNATPRQIITDGNSTDFMVIKDQYCAETLHTDCIAQFQMDNSFSSAPTNLSPGLLAVLNIPGDKKILNYTFNEQYESIMYEHQVSNSYSSRKYLEVYQSGISNPILRKSFHATMTFFDSLLVGDKLYLSGLSRIAAPDYSSWNICSPSDCDNVNGFISINLTNLQYVSKGTETGLEINDPEFSISQVNDMVIFYNLSDPELPRGFIFQAASGHYLSTLEEEYSLSSKSTVKNRAFPLLLANNTIYFPDSELSLELNIPQSNLVKINATDLSHSSYPMDGQIKSMLSFDGRIWMQVENMSELSEPDGGQTYHITSDFIIYDPQKKKVTSLATHNLPAAIDQFRLYKMATNKYLLTFQNYAVGVEFDNFDEASLMPYFIESPTSIHAGSPGGQVLILSENKEIKINSFANGSSTSMALPSQLVRVQNLPDILNSFTPEDQSRFIKVADVTPGSSVPVPGFLEIKPKFYIFNNYLYLAGISQISDGDIQISTSIARIDLTTEKIDSNFIYRFLLSMSEDGENISINDLVLDSKINPDGKMQILAYATEIQTTNGPLNSEPIPLIKLELDLTNQQLTTTPMETLSINLPKHFSDVRVKSDDLYGLLFFTEFEQNL